ncbi:hypothetical protein [Caldisalinibacter kiritimatiensis]|uniref:Lipoprotein n=1 Tax=Caldisalinibacter kiritimatiensis TaxID=1304284 RepID=R1CDS8_9FIRM|nr:hypothetical protein [Caldisalinibacter kiritimatiensis]EOD00435.1 hypothetical protein L21TH_1496 [Caldisalinibacter kiritimatiensis]
MKKVFVFIFIIICLFAACTSSVKNDLFNYINVELERIMFLETQALNNYKKIVSKDNYTYEELYEVLTNETIPTYENFYNNLTKIAPVTKEVQQAHNYYKLGAQRQLQAFKALKQGLKEKDREKLESVNKLLEESRKYMNEFQSRIVSLAKKHKLKFE